MTERKRLRRAKRLLVPVVAVGTMSGGVLAVTASPAHAAVQSGYGCAVHANVSLGGGASGTQGCGTQTSIYATSNTAAPEKSWVYGTPGSAVDQTGAKLIYGPAVMVSSPYDINDNLYNTGLLRVQTSGTTNVNVTSRATAVGPSPFYTATPSSYPISASSTGYVEGRCIASPTGTSGSTTILNGYVDTKLDDDGYPIPEYTVPVPINPPPNTEIAFTLDHIVTDGVVEHGRMVLNEQILNADGSITVNASHMYIEGPFALGDVIIGQATCLNS